MRRGRARSHEAQAAAGPLAPPEPRASAASVCKAGPAPSERRAGPACSHGRALHLGGDGGGARHPSGPRCPPPLSGGPPFAGRQPRALRRCPGSGARPRQPRRSRVGTGRGVQGRAAPRGGEGGGGRAVPRTPVDARAAAAAVAPAELPRGHDPRARGAPGAVARRAALPLPGAHRHGLGAAA